MMQDVLERFFAAESNVYLILQLKDEQETTDVRFEPFARLEQMGRPPTPPITKWSTSPIPRHIFTA